MADLTILDVTQRILSDMDSDAVNTITETIEATQVASVVRDIYENILDEHRMNNQKKLFQLDGLGDTDHPNFMSIPEGYFEIEWITYDMRTAAADSPEFNEVLYKNPAEFIAMCNARDSDDTAIDIVYDFDNNVRLHIANDRAPSSYTTFDNEYIVFDAFNSVIEDTLTSAKTQAYGKHRQDVSLADETVIDLPKHLRTLLINEAREMCFELYKDGAPQKVVRNALRSRVRAQRTDHKLSLREEGDQLPDYGRRPRR